ncbi:MAG: HAMP domain-containing sensor histidine kinase, partial [Phormidesmis sp.]
ALESEVQEREKAEESLKVYVHALTHDLRNPVTGMSHVLQSLGQQQLVGEDPPSAKIPLSVLARMQSGCDRQLKMINTLIETYNIEIWGVPIHRQPFDPSELIQAVVEEWQLSFKKKRVTITLQIDPDLPWIEGDRDQLWRVFENLLGNAIKYNPPGITLTIRAERSQWFLRYSLSDNGIGIPYDQQSALFDLYSRGTSESSISHSTPNPTQGLGLGLYISRRIVEAHGGNIGVISQPGKGAQFWFDLPIVAAR